MFDLDTKLFFTTNTEFSQQFFESAIENAYDSIIVTSATPINGIFPVIVYANKTSTKITGYSIDEIIGKTPRILQGEKTNKETLKQISTSLKNWDTVDVEVLNYKKDGTEFWSHLTITPIKDKTGYFTHWLSVQRDITEKKKIEEEIRFSEERLKTVIKAMNSGIWEWDMKENTIYWSEKMYQILGLTRKTEFVSFEFALDLIHPDDRERVLGETKNHLDNGVDFNSEFRMKKQTDEYLVVNFTGLAKRDSNNVPYLMTGSVTDVTTSKLNQEKIEYLAFHDCLTGLGNRTMLEKIMHELLESNKNQNIFSIAFIYIDLDGFKKINDTFGHEIGDEVLLEVSRRLNLIVTTKNSIYRLGGDEFLIIQNNFNSKIEIISLAEEIKIILSETYLIQNLICKTGASIGISFYPEDGKKFTELLRKSDEAMYSAKKNGKQRLLPK